MNDDELVEALRTGLDAIDPPPPSLLAKALDAGQWSGLPAQQARDVGGELAGSGMRAAPDDVDRERDGLLDLAFESEGHRVDVTLDAEVSARAGTTMLITVTPPVDAVTIVSPFDEPQSVTLDPSGAASIHLEVRAVAIEFFVAGELVRTPLIRLL